MMMMLDGLFSLHRFSVRISATTVHTKLLLCIHYSEGKGPLVYCISILDSKTFNMD